MIMKCDIKNECICKKRDNKIWVIKIKYIRDMKMDNEKKVLGRCII